MQQLGQKQGPPLPIIHAVHRNDVSIPLIVTTYIVLSLCNIFVEKYLTTTSKYELQYPLFALLLQLITTLALIQLLKWCQSRYVMTNKWICIYIYYLIDTDIDYFVFYICRRNPWFFRFYSLSTTGWKATLPATGIYTLIVVLDIYFLTPVPATMYTSMYASCVLITLALGMLFAQKKYRRRQRGGGHWTATMPVWSSCLVQCLGVWFSGATATDGFSMFTGQAMCYTLLLALYGYSIQKALVDLKNDVSLFLQWHLILASLAVLSMVLVLDEGFSAPYQFILTLDQVEFWTQMVKYRGRW